MVFSQAKCLIRILESPLGGFSQYLHEIRVYELDTWLAKMIIWLNFTPKITKIQELPGASPPGPPSTGGLD